VAAADDGWAIGGASMRQSQLPLLGLFLALLVGARVGTTGGSSDGGAAASSVGTSYSSSTQIAKPGSSRVTKRAAKPVSSLIAADAASDLVQTGCDEITATAKAGTFQISKSLQTSEDCLPALPPLYETLCRLNPEYGSSHTLRQDSELAVLKANEPTLPDCLVGLSDQGVRIDSVMASVADPEHTHLGLLTDRAIEAIQVAAGRAGYNPYSHYLPWTSSNSPDSSDDSSKAAAADSHQPGLLIFRKDSKEDATKMTKTRYLAVFLISEMPTTGLDQESFFSAKSIMDQISDELKQPRQQSIRFAGPNFSGSLASLEDVDSKLDQTQCIRAFSGQVTAATYFKDKGACKSELVLTQTPDCVAVPIVVKGLRDYYGYQAHEIALLSEGGTAYGENAANMGSGNDRAQANAGEPANVNPLCSPPTGETDVSGLLNLRFPREISKLRNAYGAANSATPSTGSATQQNTDLQLTWQDSQATRGDDVPAYGGQQTPLSQDAVLSSLATALKAHDIKALGILATDPMDEAFLIRSFRKSSPDVRLFLRDPDLLYLRTPDVGSLNGTLLVNNYSMLLRNQHWSAGSPEDANNAGLVTFSSAGQEAQFDAFLLLLRDVHHDFPDGGNDPALLEWNWPSGNPGTPDAKVPTSDMPPLWLTTIGTTGQFPLAMLNADNSKEAKLLPQTLYMGRPRRVALLVWFLFVLLGAVHVCGLIWPNALPRFLSDDFDLGDAGDTITASKAICHMGILLSLALIQLILGSSYVFFRDSNSDYAWLAGGVMLVAAILTVTAGVVFMIRVAWPWWQSRGGATFRNEEISGIFRPVLGGVVCVVIFATIGVVWIHWASQPTFGNAFLHYRDLILTSGVAPGVPIVLLLVIAYLGAWVYLRRLTYWGYRRPPLPNVALDGLYLSEFTKIGRLIDKCILGFLESPGWSFGFLVVFLAGLAAFRPWTTMEIAEVPFVRGTLVALFVLALFVLELNWFRFVNIWFRLRNLLEGLERLPIRHAFERMPAEKSMPIWGWGISDNSFMPTSQAIERLRALVLADDTVVNALSVRELRSCIAALGKFDRQKKRGIVKLLVRLLRGPREQLVELPQAVGAARMFVSVKASPDRLTVNGDTPPFGEVLHGARQAMTEVVNQLILFLRPGYWQRGSDGSKEEIPPKPELRTFVLAEDLVAMRYYTYIRYVVTELRNLLFFIAMAFSLLFLAFHTYAFRVGQMIDWSFLVLFLILGAGVTLVLYQMELDPILSHFGGGQPGEVGWSFYLNLLKYGAVPFLTIIGSQVPAVSNVLLRWVQPTLQSLR
jgi:hypothetical protein